MLSLTCKAAVKAVIYLASQANEKKKINFKEIATHINENEHTVGKLLQKLVRDNVIKSTKGPFGGFYITSEQKKLPIKEIIVSIDGNGLFSNCGLGLSQCSELRPCPIHNEFKPIRELIEKMCTERKISELYEDVNKGLSYLIG